jgi:hypothetical protein
MRDVSRAYARNEIEQGTSDVDVRSLIRCRERNRGATEVASRVRAYGNEINACQRRAKWAALPGKMNSARSIKKGILKDHEERASEKRN